MPLPPEYVLSILYPLLLVLRNLLSIKDLRISTDLVGIHFIPQSSIFRARIQSGFYGVNPCSYKGLRRRTLAPDWVIGPKVPRH